MKNLRQFCAAVVLTLALATYAAAGTIHLGFNSPPPPPASMTEEETQTVQADGTIHLGVAESEPEAAAVMGIALNVLQSMMSVF